MSPDLSLHTALSHLLAHLTTPLEPLVGRVELTLLRTHLRSILTLLFAPSWQADDLSRGSAFRSLIGRPGRLPRPLRQAAAKASVDLALWERALVEACEGEVEWQSWCDPGRVQWRNGGWEWEDGVWFHGGWKGASPHLLRPPPPLQHSLTHDSLVAVDVTTTLWTTSAGVPTPRVSHAVTIRSPIPATPNSNAATPMPPSHLLPHRSITPPTPTRSTSPHRLATAGGGSSTPAPLTSANLLALPLPPFAERPDSPSAASDVSSSTFTSVSGASTLSQTSSSHPAIHADGRALLSAANNNGGGGNTSHHKRVSSIGSNSSAASSSSALLLGPTSRSLSPMLLADASGGRKRPVTAYDGGKVGVLGGGVKLGGGAGSSGPTSPRKPRTHGGSGGGYHSHGGQQQQQHHRPRSGHRLHHHHTAVAGPFGQPIFAAPAALASGGGYPPMPASAAAAGQHAYSGVFNVGF